MSNSNLFAQKIKEINLNIQQEEQVISLILDMLKNEDDKLKQDLYKLVEDFDI